MRRWTTDRRLSTKCRHRQLAEATRVEIAELEARVLFHASPIPGWELIVDDDGGIELPPADPSLVQTQDAGGGTGATGASVPLASVPLLSSRPSASAKIYLDFLGDVAQTWGSYNVPATPAYSQDADTSTFTSGELDAIQQIWSRVAESYSPFNIDVTTVNPGNLSDGQTVKVVIGGSGSWLGSAGGVAYLGSFTNYLPNVAWVFPGQLGNGYPKYVGDAAAHEAGHTFGLVHQSAYSGTTKTAEYRGGDSLVAPIMGVSYYSTRAKWSNGQSANGYNVYQDDLSIISNATNGFGYRADDHGNTIGAADALDVNNDTVSGSGVIENKSDVDVFSFVTSAGNVSFTVNVAQYGAMLDATLKLVDLNGNVIASSDTTSLGESVSATLAEGSYRLIVSSKGAYGDVGQYTISGTIVPSANYVAAPSNLAASVGTGGVSLAWYDNPWNETGFVVERSDDGGNTWNPLDTTAANTHGYVDATAQVGHRYLYRVYAFNDTDQSAKSNTATASVLPPTPTGLTAASISASRIDLSWIDVNGETGYVIERATDRTGWVTVATVGADVSSWSDGTLAAGTRYYYRLHAISGVGSSATTAPVNAFTRPAQSNLSLAAISTSQMNLAWKDVLGETGYRIERTADGSHWSVIGTRGANVTTWGDTGLTANTVYSYRVIAVNSGGDGVAANATNTTLLPAPTGLAVTAPTTSQVNLTWTDSTGETGYRIERSLDNRSWYVITSVAADVTSYSNTGLAGGTAYVYRVRAINAGGVSVASATAGTTTVPLAPSISASAASDTLITLRWSNVNGETSYVLQRSDDGVNGWTTLASPLANVVSYNDPNLTADTPYFYRVIAHNASGDSAASNVVAARTLLPSVTGLVATGISTSQVNLAWDDSTGETGYRVERFNGSVWAAIATLNADATSYSNLGLAAGTTYYFRIRAINAGGLSLVASGIAGTTIPLATTLSVSAASTSSIRLSWSNVVGETGYRVERSTDGSSDWSVIATPAANVVTYLDTGLAPDTPYFYRVTAFNGSGDAQVSLAKMTRTLLPAPTGLVATAFSASRIDLAWDDSTGETGYVIERSTNGVNYATIATVAADVTSFPNTGLVAGTTYYYRIRAANAGGNSDVSARASTITMPAAPSIGGSALSTSQINLSWGNVAGETGYRLETSADGSNWSVLTTTSANYVTYANTGLSTDTLHYYRVIAFNSSGDGGVSAIISRRTVLAAPTGLVTTPSPTSVALSWNDSTGETGYRIERFNGVNWAAIATTGANVTSFTNTGLVKGRTYYYRIRAINAGGDSAPTAGVAALTPTSAPVVRSATAVRGATAFATRPVITDLAA
ncbi:MAG TPA: fibronectin type III domain-containing protein [Tepidisphaeraceae bacterium]